MKLERLAKIIKKVLVDLSYDIAEDFALNEFNVRGFDEFENGEKCQNKFALCLDL
jgi:hypothetical protein